MSAKDIVRVRDELPELKELHIDTGPLIKGHLSYVSRFSQFHGTLFGENFIANPIELLWSHKAVKTLSAFPFLRHLEVTTDCRITSPEPHERCVTK